MNIEIVEYGSKKHSLMNELRNEVLRKPLGLELNSEDTKGEEHDIHIAYIEDEKVLGTIILRPMDESLVRMRQVAVDENSRGKSIGTKLIKFAEDIAKQKNFSRIEASARNEAIPFYTKKGYTIVGDEFISKRIGTPHHTIQKNI